MLLPLLLGIGGALMFSVTCCCPIMYCCVGLKVVGTPHVLLSTSEDLPLLASSLPQLQQLHFAGGFTQLRPAGRHMQVSCIIAYSSSQLLIVVASRNWCS
jgi:hypothetical protein